MNTRSVNSAAGVILAAMQQNRTPAGIALALEAAGLLMSPEAAKDMASVSTDAVSVAERAVDELRREHEESARLRSERNEFCDRVDTLTAVAKGNKQHVQSLFAELQRAQRERDEARARVAELEAERAKYVGREPTIAEEMAYLSRCLDSVLALCEQAEKQGVTSGGPFTVDAVRAAAEGLVERTSYPPALSWARLMDDEDLEEFLADLTAAIVGRDGEAAIAEIEDTCARWRAIAEAQHAHNTAPGEETTR
ncbi:hypothetical protein ACFW6E_08690 [Streptomyces olivaceoviridis]|uniref:hypothetical protein n=1 Tax=Streptomyces olivaceoviridis TaxID=1921 RepID=UPI00369AD4C6